MLHKARHERTRNRTRERALLHVEQLSEALALAPQAEAAVSEAGGATEGVDAAAASLRLCCAFTVWFPLHVSTVF